MEETPIQSPYKVLIVDDSAIVRGLVTRMMAEDAEIEVVGSVNNGEEALAVMAKGGIEVVVLDIEMPVMDGLTALPKLLEIDPTVRVIMASTLTKRNADISFQAMTLGAVDYIPKPSSSKDLNVGEGFRAELIDKVKAWAEQRRKMIEADQQTATAAIEAAAEADQAPKPDAAAENPAETDDSPASGPSEASGEGDANAPYRAQMAIEHQQLQKSGRIQRKRFTAELRPRPMQQHRPQHPMQMRQQPQHPPSAEAAKPASPTPSATNAPSGAEPMTSALAGHPAPTTPGTAARSHGAPRDPGRLIRDAALAMGGAAKSSAAKAGAPAAKAAASARAPAARAPLPPRPNAPAPKPKRTPARNIAAPAAAAPRQSGGGVSLLPEKRLNVEAIAIGSSTGGPQALFEVLRGLNGVRQPIFITQHMPATFTTILAEHITRLTGMKCQEGQNGMQIIGGQVYLAPGDYHMTVEGRGNARQIKLNQNPPENFCRPSVDPMLRSLVDSYGGNILTAILTGMGQDGMLGGRNVVGAGGMVIAQDEQTSVVWGMPGAAAHAGICSAVLPVGGIAAYIKKFAGGR
ncbi:response regulator [Thalassospira sp. MA62]|nr:response regulator [Thalassospira sp. MA62]